MKKKMIKFRDYIDSSDINSLKDLKERLNKYPDEATITFVDSVNDAENYYFESGYLRIEWFAEKS